MKLFNKGLFLVALPSLFGLALLVALLYSQEQSVRAVASSMHSKDVLDQVNDAMLAVVNESGRFRGAILSKEPSMAPDAFWQSLDADLGKLEAMVADNPDQLLRAADLRSEVRQYRTALARTLEITLGGDQRAIADRYQGLAKSGALLRLRSTAEAFIQTEKKLEARRLAAADAARRQQRIAMGLVMLCSVIVSVIATSMFARGIGARLSVLTGNARRLADHQTLLPVVPGEDEIAELDRALHDASERLLEAERQQAMLQGERSARAQAEEAARLKDEFVITLSHELRTPLNSIIGWAEILRRSNLDEERLQKGLDVIYRNAQLQVKMVNDLLEMSSILTGRIRLELQRISLAEIIEQVLLTVTPTAESKNIRLVKVLGSADPVQGDSSRIHQIVWNLLTNAIKFTPKGGKVQVSLGRVGSEVAISVTDDGKGISAAFIPHVFDRFKQEDTGLSRRSGGLGLGLAIVRQLTELHGGRVEARSDGEGKGATFIVHFPVPSSHLPDSRMSDTSTSQFGTERPLQKARIVLLEDDRDARELVVQLLEDAGAEVRACADGESGLRALQEQEDVDLILSDLGMPGVDGYEFIRRLRVQEAELGRKRVLVVALTALARTEDRQMALLAGFHAHIAKPVNPAELTVVVASALGRTGSSWSG